MVEKYTGFLLKDFVQFRKFQDRTRKKLQFGSKKDKESLKLRSFQIGGSDRDAQSHSNSNFSPGFQKAGVFDR